MPSIESLYIFMHHQRFLQEYRFEHKYEIASLRKANRAIHMFSTFLTYHIVEHITTLL